MEGYDASVTLRLLLRPLDWRAFTLLKAALKSTTYQKSKTHKTSLIARKIVCLLGSVIAIPHSEPIQKENKIVRTFIPSFIWNSYGFIAIRISTTKRIRSSVWRERPSRTGSPHPLHPSCMHLLGFVGFCVGVVFGVKFKYRCTKRSMKNQLTLSVRVTQYCSRLNLCIFVLSCKEAQIQSSWYFLVFFNPPSPPPILFKFAV